MEVRLDESNKSNKLFLTVVFIFIIFTRNRFMDVDPFGRKATVEEVFPPDGRLLVDQVFKVSGKFAWVDWWGWPVLKTQEQ